MHGERDFAIIILIFIKQATETLLDPQSGSYLLKVSQRWYTPAGPITATSASVNAAVAISTIYCSLCTSLCRKCFLQIKIHKMIDSGYCSSSLSYHGELNRCSKNRDLDHAHFLNSF